MALSCEQWIKNSPDWLKSRRHRPPDYVRLFQELSQNGLIRSEEVTGLLLRSGLHTQHLGNIRFLLNNPTNLNEEEFTIFLALIGSYQKEAPVYDLNTLFKVSVPHTPTFSNIFPPTANDAWNQPNSTIISQPPLILEDEFSEFQSGFPLCSEVKPGRDIGSRLANYNLSLSSESHHHPQIPSSSNAPSQDKQNLLGEEDKYSALRAFLQHESSHGKQESQQGAKADCFDADFGDFQSFSQTMPAEHLQTPSLLQRPQKNPFLIDISTSQPTKGITPPESLSSLTNSGLDDFGDFVSFSEAPSLPTVTPFSTATQQSDLLSDLIGLEFGVSARKVETSSQKFRNERGNSLDLFGMDLPQVAESPRPLAFQTPRAFPLQPLRTTLISGPSTNFSDPFGQFEDATTTVRQGKTAINYMDSECFGRTDGSSPLPRRGSRPLVQEGNADEEEKVRRDWRRCLVACVSLLEEGERIFHSASSSGVLRGVLETDKGRSYLLGLREVYLVASRIYQSWMRLGGDAHLGELHQKLALSWDSFAPFLMGTDLEDGVHMERLFPAESAVTERRTVCGICLFGTQPTNDGEDDERLSLDFGGKLYHLTCANLWINQLDSTLPNLSI